VAGRVIRRSLVTARTWQTGSIGQNWHPEAAQCWLLSLSPPTYLPGRYLAGYGLRSHVSATAEIENEGRASSRTPGIRLGHVAPAGSQF